MIKTYPNSTSARHPTSQLLDYEQFSKANHNFSANRNFSPIPNFRQGGQFKTMRKLFSKMKTYYQIHHQKSSKMSDFLTFSLRSAEMYRVFRNCSEDKIKGDETFAEKTKRHHPKIIRWSFGSFEVRTPKELADEVWVLSFEFSSTCNPNSAGDEV